MKLKNKLILVLIVLLFIFFTANIVLATDVENEVQAITTDETTESSDDTYSEDDSVVVQDASEAESSVTETQMENCDIFLTGTDIVVDTIVDGNLVVMGQNVTIDTQIGGDCLIIADTITITENSYIYSNLFAISTDLTVSGIVYDIYTCSDTVTIDGYIYRDLKAICSNLNLYGVVGRNAYVDSDNILFQNDEQGLVGIIYGDLNYTSNIELSFLDENITGETYFTMRTSTNTNNISSIIMSCLTIIVTSIIIYLITIKTKNKLVQKTDLISSKKILPVLGLGICTLILLPVLSIVLALIVATIPLSIIVLLINLLLLILSIFVLIITITNLAINKLNITNQFAKLGVLILVSAIVWLLTYIPYLGGLILLIEVILGIGMIVYTISLKIKNKNKLKDNIVTKTEDEIK